ncbi:uncharacterized protein [Narcine bancroftii]|uniref:uncharacterized protein isoform X2 n=1 Tax=Narcine bancroftii TaxID=1343680 RepID=UPI00383117B4
MQCIPSLPNSYHYKGPCTPTLTIPVLLIWTMLCIPTYTSPSSDLPLQALTSATHSYHIPSGQLFQFCTPLLRLSACPWSHTRPIANFPFGHSPTGWEKTGGTVDVVISATSLQHQRSGLESNIVRSLYILSCLQEFSLETLVSSHCSKRTSFHVLAL